MVNESARLDGAGLGFAYSILRSARRRSIGIEVRNAQVSVRAPIGVAESVLVGFLREKSAWVVRKIQEQQTRQASQPAPVVAVYHTGSALALMDEHLHLVIGEGSRAAVARYDSDLHLLLSRRVSAAPQTQIRALLSRWYEQQALHILTAKTQQLCMQLGLVCQQVKVRATRSKWGHCTSAGVIQYNWQILLAPEAVVDYLVAHEVCHLRHHNHSPAFWALVASVCPEYAALRRWLRQAGASLHL